ncbi:hypothetical protein AMTR_s00076p00046090 [Amborella trichopoda]|uniref:Uncharacterized protein n=1 Tax=Amborella trichopoda TaxID=13333 RepID=W1P9N9_AMBTC|nr:hypothetical protein AMTR_s00076p00046090 [Amborella trichopoda]
MARRKTQQAGEVNDITLHQESPDNQNTLVGQDHRENETENGNRYRQHNQPIKPQRRFTPLRQPLAEFLDNSLRKET